MVSFSGVVKLGYKDMFNADPFITLNSWLNEESEAGAPNPKQGVLSTSTVNAVPHSRVVAVKKVTKDGLIFFTQKGTRKVFEIKQNPRASFVFWFELFQREVILDGAIEALTNDENNCHWQEYPREAQVRFYSYAPTSSQPIESKHQLEILRTNIRNEYQDKEIPISQHYCGFRLIPKRLAFYAYRLDELSDVMEYKLVEQNWHQQVLSP